HWFAEVIADQEKGEIDPITLAARNIAMVRDGAVIVIDMGGGYGAGVHSHLKNNVQGLRLQAHTGADKSGKRRRDKKRNFYDKRAEAWWKFREALAPNLGEPVALHPDPETLADLTAPRWQLTPRGMQIESKQDIRKRLGRPP